MPGGQPNLLSANQVYLDLLEDLALKEQERNQPTAGRLDLLFQDPDSNLRYSVEGDLKSGIPGF